MQTLSYVDTKIKYKYNPNINVQNVSVIRLVYAIQATQKGLCSRVQRLGNLAVVGTDQATIRVPTQHLNR